MLYFWFVFVIGVISFVWVFYIYVYERDYYGESLLREKILLFIVLFFELCEKWSEKILVNGWIYFFCVF